MSELTLTFGADLEIQVYDSEQVAGIVTRSVIGNRDLKSTHTSKSGSKKTSTGAEIQLDLENGHPGTFSTNLSQDFIVSVATSVDNQEATVLTTTNTNTGTIFSTDSEGKPSQFTTTYGTTYSKTNNSGDSNFSGFGLVLGGTLIGGDLEGSVTTDGWDARSGDFGQFGDNDDIPGIGDLTTLEDGLGDEDEFKFNRFRTAKVSDSNGEDENTYTFNWTFYTTPGEVDDEEVTGGEIDVSGTATNTRKHTHNSNTTKDDHQSADLERDLYFNELAQEYVNRTTIEALTKENEGQASTGASTVSNDSVIEIDGEQHLRRVIENGDGPAFQSLLSSETTYVQDSIESKLNRDDPDLPGATQGYKVVNTSSYDPLDGQASTTHSLEHKKTIEEALVKHIPMSSGVLDLLHSTGLGGDISFGGNGGSDDSQDSSAGDNTDDASDARILQNAAGEILGFETSELEEGDYISGKLKLTEDSSATEAMKINETLEVNIKMTEPTRRLTIDSTKDFESREAETTKKSELVLTYGENGSIESKYDDTSHDKWVVSTDGDYSFFTADTGWRGADFESENGGDLRYEWGGSTTSSIDGSDRVTEEYGRVSTEGINGFRIRDGDLLKVSEDGGPTTIDETENYEKVIESVTGSAERDHILRGSFLQNRASATFTSEDDNSGGGGTGGPGGGGDDGTGTSQSFMTLTRTVQSSHETTGDGFAGDPGDSNNSNSVTDTFPVLTTTANTLESFGYLADEARSFVSYMSLESGEAYADKARAWAVLLIAGGLAETQAGPLGIAHGVDTAWAGLKQLWYGDYVRTYTSKAISTSLQFGGVSGEDAEFYGEIADAVLGFGTGVVGVNKAATKVIRGAAKFVPMGDKVADVARGLGKTIGKLRNADELVDASKVADDVSIATEGAVRQLRLPKTDPSLTGTNTFGYTTANGDVFLQPGLSRAQQAATLRHEGVHAFLSVADDAPLGSLRQRIGIGAYNNSAFFNAAEEILAEGIASRSLSQGVRHAFNGAYTVRGGRVVTPLATLSEFSVGATGLGLFGYGAYEFGSWLYGDGE